MDEFVRFFFFFFFVAVFREIWTAHLVPWLGLLVKTSVIGEDDLDD